MAAVQGGIKVNATFSKRSTVVINSKTTCNLPRIELSSECVSVCGLCVLAERALKKDPELALT